MEVFTEFVKISALLISFTYMFGRFQRFFQYKPDYAQTAINGLLFSAVAIIGMMIPIELGPGVLLDSSIIIVAFSVVFGGIGSGLITAFLSCIYRFYLGNTGQYAGILIVFSGIALGALLRYIRINKQYRNNFITFINLGLFSAFLTFPVFLLLPEMKMSMLFISRVLIPIHLIFPLISYTLGVLLVREKKQIDMENELKARISRKRKILAVSNDGFFEWNLKRSTVSFDANFYTMAGYIPNEFPENRDEWFKRIHPDDKERLSQRVNAFIEGEKSFDEDFRFKRKDGSWMWVRSRATVSERDFLGKAISIIGNHSDITKIKDAQQELKRLYSAIEQAVEIVMILDDQGAIQYLNSSFTKITGFSKEDVLGTSGQTILRNDQDKNLFSTIWSEISMGNSWSGQLKNRRKDGEMYTEEAIISPVRGESGIITSYVAIIRDITRDLNFQEQLQHSQKMQAIGQLAGGVAHDFNNMLTGIMTATLMLKKSKTLDDKAQKYLSIIDEAVQRSAGLTQSLLAFSRKQPQALNIIDLHNSINKTVKLLKSTLNKRIAIETNLYSGSSSIIGDTVQIENSLLNLGINASHAIENNGTIKITTKIDYFEKSDCLENVFDIEPGAYIHLSVEDDGTGIGPENMQKIFEPFFTTKGISKGTGLGLATVYSMIVQHKGTVSVKSEVGRGTEFHLYFPAIEKNVTAEVKAPFLHPEVQGEGCILVVDDEKLIRTPINDMLLDSGYKVYIADDGEMALKVYREHMDEIDLVIMDVIMPKMNGYECMKELRKINPQIKIIVESGYSSSETILKMKQLGIHGLIHKPSSGGTIRTAIKEALLSQ
ncbi:MAG: PAS domain-containing protein [Spirochaetaceae bacterium]|nr:PAS domain-containing protein [Spirochaetaceae bacterium]